jgi:hypothetical protein
MYCLMLILLMKYLCNPSILRGWSGKGLMQLIESYRYSFNTAWVIERILDDSLKHESQLENRFHLKSA